MEGNYNKLGYPHSLSYILTLLKSECRCIFVQVFVLFPVVSYRQRVCVCVCPNVVESMSLSDWDSLTQSPSGLLCRVTYSHEVNIVKVSHFNTFCKTFTILLHFTILRHPCVRVGVLSNWKWELISVCSYECSLKS